MTPTLVLTRPEAQSRSLAAEFEAMAPVVVSPVLEIVGTGAKIDLAGFAGVILTSANAVPFAPDLRGIRAYCVGKRTAAAADAAGATVRLAAQDAEELIGAMPGPGPLLHLRGEHARGKIAERLTSAGIETHSVVIYRQISRPLSAEARTLIEGTAPVVLPLFSPRSAKLVGASVDRVGPRVAAIAMSPAVADSWRAVTRAAAEVCTRPTGGEMRERIAGKLRG